MGNKTVLITGATGMVGGHVLRLLLEHDDVEKVISIGRRLSGIEHSRLFEVQHDNFLDFEGEKENLSGIDLCIYCLGVYQGQVTKDQFMEITCEYQKALTDVLQETSPDLTFVLFGASGADPSEKRVALFAKGEGRAERYLNETIFPKKIIFRPGYIHPTGDKKPIGFAYKLLLPIAGLLFGLCPKVGVRDITLARAMVLAGLGGRFHRSIHNNADIRMLGEK